MKPIPKMKAGTVAPVPAGKTSHLIQSDCGNYTAGGQE